MKKRTSVLIYVILAAAAFFAALCLGACGQTEEGSGVSECTVTFVSEEAEVATVTGAVGAAVDAPAAPQKQGYVFVGWYTAPTGGTDIAFPATMPGVDTTYYARFAAERKVIYDYNLGAVAHSGRVPDTVGGEGYPVTVEDGKRFGARGYTFVGWSTSANGLVSVSGIAEDGQYLPGDELVLGETNVTLYAQWAVEYACANQDAQPEYRLFVYSPRVGKGLGAIIAETGSERKYGFVKPKSETGTAYDTFDFYNFTEDGATLSGRLYDDRTYLADDGMRGVYFQYLYATDEEGVYILTTDGFGSASLSVMVGDQLAMRQFGAYVYNEEYEDYTFIYMDAETGLPVVEDDSYVSFYFVIDRVEKSDPDAVGPDGTFTIGGMESGSYMLYENGELLGYKLELNGYGYARLYQSAEDGADQLLVAEAHYRGTEDYYDTYGEWEFGDEGDADYFKFMLNYITSDDGYIMIYTEYDESSAGTFTSGADKLELNGYGFGEYTSGGQTYSGVVTVSGSGLVTLLYYEEDEDGELYVAGKLYFSANFKAGTFELNTTGIITDIDEDQKTIIVDYAGESQVVVLPEVDGVAANAFNYTRSESEVSLVSVTIPASIKTIGSCAFENNSTLKRAIFLSETPIDIDWSAANDPFRWPAGNFIIVVPEGSQQAYINAWPDCKHAIKGSVEVTQLPIFEVENGVLVRYNGTEEDGTQITIPNDVTEISARVFMGLDFLTAVDLNNVQAVGDYAFYGCSAVTEFTANGLKTVGACAFGACSSVTSMYLPNIVTLGESAFTSCYKLKLVKLGASLRSVGMTCFLECHVYESEPPLVMELMFTTLPDDLVMLGGIGKGNISFKIKVQSISVVLECYQDPYNWNSYCRHLFVESGEEKGYYMSGKDTLNVDGRAELSGAYVFMYSITGTTITFYYYDEEELTVYTYTGTIENGIITVSFMDKDFVFEKYGTSETFTSENGEYTLVCDPKALLGETYASAGYSGTTTATLNGQQVSVTVAGNSTRINGYVDSSDGRAYDITFTLEARTFVVISKKLAQQYVRNITAADGSVINLHFTESNVYVFGSLKIEVESGVYLPEWSDWAVTATTTEQNVYTFTRAYKQDRYEITVTVSDNGATFTYTYRKL